MWDLVTDIASETRNISQTLRDVISATELVGRSFIYKRYEGKGKNGYRHSLIFLVSLTMFITRFHVNLSSLIKPKEASRIQMTK